MAISVSWPTGVISIPQSYLTSLGSGVYSLDVDALRLDLKALEDDEEGIVGPDTHTHNTEVTMSGTTYSPFVSLIKG